MVSMPLSLPLFLALSQSDGGGKFASSLTVLREGRRQKTVITVREKVENQLLSVSGKSGRSDDRQAIVVYVLVLLV